MRGEKIIKQEGQVRRLELEVGRMRTRSESQMRRRPSQPPQQIDNAGQRLAPGEVHSMQGRQLANVLLLADGQLGPLVEDAGDDGSGSALEAGFYRPGHGISSVPFEDEVGAVRVEVFRVEEEAVHVEETGPDGGEA